MEDCEDADYLKEHWTSSPKRIVMKDTKKNEKSKRSRETHKIVQKKKKNSKFKEAMMEKKEKKKGKRKEKDKNKRKGKKKNKRMLNLDDFILTEGSKSLGAVLNEKLSSAKEPKRKRKVVFAPFPSYIRIKRPTFTSSTPKEAEAARDGESCSQLMGRKMVGPQDDDFQQNSDDINSQDLFITQKMFRATPSESSGSEAGDSAISESPRVFTQRDKNQHATMGRIKRLTETPTHQRMRIKAEPEEEVCRLLKESNRSGEKTVSEQDGVNSSLDDLLIINPTPDAVSIKPRSSYRVKISEPPTRPTLANSSTQTDNFFNTELSSYLSFCWKNRASLQPDDIKPLDLSLPHRARLNVAVKHAQVKCHEQDASSHKGETSSDGMSASPRAKHPDVKREASCQGEATPSPQSEAETRSANTTASSEDDGRTGKRDVSQVGGIQLRLNKPFFFKSKGEALSPRPASPLMKLSQGRDVKPKKGRSRRT